MSLWRTILILLCLFLILYAMDVFLGDKKTLTTRQPSIPNTYIPTIKSFQIVFFSRTHPFNTFLPYLKFKTFCLCFVWCEYLGIISTSLSFRFVSPSSEWNAGMEIVWTFWPLMKQENKYNLKWLESHLHLNPKLSHLWCTLRQSTI